MRFVLVLFSLFGGLSAFAQGQFLLKKDLQADWLTSDSVVYRKFSDGNQVKTVYLELAGKMYKTDYLQVESVQPVSVLLNNRLLADRVTMLSLPVDSLMQAYATPNFFIAIHSQTTIDPRQLHTRLVSPVLHAAGKPDESYLKTKTSFRDYTITALLILVLFLISIVRLNPGLSSDYFSIRKIFSLRESEDDHYYYRVTSATILFYVFVSLLLGLYMLVVTRFTGINLHLGNLVTASFWELIYAWLTVSLYVLLFLFAKIVVIYVVSSLFGIREIAGYHFFNFVRLLLVTTGIFSLVLVFYFIPHGQGTGFYKFLYAIILWIPAIWIGLGFFKLASRIRHSAFHLFSYICATELVPFFLIIEVLNT